MEGPNYIYRCVVSRVVDGDTVDADIDLGFNMFSKDRIRLMGLDTPESRTRNKHEKLHGLAAKNRLKSLLKSAELIPGKRGKKQVFLETSKEGKGKFGRILAVLFSDYINVNTEMIKEGLGIPYYGGKRSVADFDFTDS